MNKPGFTATELAEVKTLAVRQSAQVTVETRQRFDAEQRALILRTCCGGASESEAAVLIAIAEQRGLNPITGECYFVKRWDSAKRAEVWAVQAAIDSFRIKADEAGNYDGQDEPEYEYDDGSNVPSLARVRIWRKGIGRPLVGVARYDEYVQRTKEGAPTRFWKTMPHNQLAKCAEALGFRKAFPSHFAKIYTPEEMAQADNAEPAHDVETGEVIEQRPAPVATKQLPSPLPDFIAILRSASTLEELKTARVAVKAKARTMPKGALSDADKRALADTDKALEAALEQRATKADPDAPNTHMGEPTDGAPPEDELGGRM